ncbi:MAG TPA: hypothetical protein VG102_03925 [Candidatus Paceibacterota bacterium]|jgi:hypothetical protein|nr:hypothetical protein [Candidatus Paceibacterota bacterium]
MNKSTILAALIGAATLIGLSAPANAFHRGAFMPMRFPAMQMPHRQAAPQFNGTPMRCPMYDTTGGGVSPRDCAGLAAQAHRRVIWFDNRPGANQVGVVTGGSPVGNPGGNVRRGSTSYVVITRHRHTESRIATPVQADPPAPSAASANVDAVPANWHAVK